MATVLAVELWRSFQLEERLLRAEVERSLLVGERLLRRASTSDAVFESIDATSRCTLRGGRVLVDARVGWLWPIDAEADRDLIVEDRLDRAARAEFVDRDHRTAALEFDDLLDGPLQASHRLQVLAAAAWQARRWGGEERLAGLAGRLRTRFEGLDAQRLASPLVASALASAVRLEVDAIAAPTAAALLPFLPRVPFAALPADEPMRRRHHQVASMRDELRLVDRLCRDSARPPAPGLHAVTPDRVVWLRPAADGEQRAAVLSPRAWFEALLRGGEREQLIEWPARVEPVFGSAVDDAFAGVPGVVELRAVDVAGLGSRSWLVPSLAGLLMFGFVLAFVQLRRAARKETEAMATQAQFLTTVTHELKTPLAGIRLLGEMLAEGRAVGREQSYYQLLVGEAARLTLLIDNVLDLGRLERGQRVYDLRPIELAPVVHETMRMFGPVLEQAGIEVAVDDRLGAAIVNVDRDALVQALVIVLDNARKYGASGKRVEVRAWADPDGAFVAVRDFGPGVPVGEREAIFERFRRGDAHRHGSTPGVGIGLYLARAIARRMAGELRHVAPGDDRAGGDAAAGAEFRFHLQLERTT